MIKKAALRPFVMLLLAYFVFLAFVVAVLGLVVAVSLVLAFAFLVDAGLSINLRQSS